MTNLSSDHSTKASSKTSRHHQQPPFCTDHDNDPEEGGSPPPSMVEVTTTDLLKKIGKAEAKERKVSFGALLIGIAIFALACTVLSFGGVRSSDGRYLFNLALFDKDIPTQPPTAAPATMTISSWTRIGSTLTGVAAGDVFGDYNALDLSSDGTIVAVGARFNADVAHRAGRVQVFQRSGGNEWQPMGPALKGDAAREQFGRSLALSSNGRVLAVGATENPFERPGYVRVFEYESPSNQWNPRGSKIEGVAVGDFFGSSVALSSDGNKLAAGTPSNDDNGDRAGQVRVFAFDSKSNEWVQHGSNFTGVNAGDAFGNSVDLSTDGTILAVGASGNDDNGPNSGHVRTYQFNSNSNDWDPLGEAILGVAADNFFGGSVALSSNGMVLAAGAPTNSDNGSASGHVRVFDYNTSANRWIQRGSAIAGVDVFNYFGVSVALSADGDQVTTGADGNSDNATSSGHIRVFEYDPLSGDGTGQWKQVGAALTGVGGEGDTFGVSVAMSADGMVVAGGSSQQFSKSDESPGYVCVYEGVVE